MNRWMMAAVAALVVLVGGVAGFAISRATDGGMNGGDHGAMAYEGSMMGGSGPDWSGTTMDMGAMPGAQQTDHGMIAMSDQAFLTMMVLHHGMAVDMARAELASGKDPATKALARRVIAAQSKEIAQMRAWYRDWYGTEPPRVEMSGSMAMMGMGMDADVIRTSADPDRAFLQMMIPHHAGAVMMADMTLASDPRGEVKGLAKQIIADQSNEIAAIQAMRERLAPPLG